jgi:2-keto-3-deoxy-L-rhamnonate aldolase RhmA
MHFLCAADLSKDPDDNGNPSLAAAAKKVKNLISRITYGDANAGFIDEYSAS